MALVLGIPACGGETATTSGLDCQMDGALWSRASRVIRQFSSASLNITSVTCRSEHRSTIRQEGVVERVALCAGAIALIMFSVVKTRWTAILKIMKAAKYIKHSLMDDTLSDQRILSSDACLKCTLTSKD